MISTPVGASVVGWNCIISMSFSGTPTRSAIVIPSPVHAYALVVPEYMRPGPPVARITAFAESDWRPPCSRFHTITPTQRPPSSTSFHAKNSS